MPDAFTRARYFRDRAEECLRLADIVSNREIAAQYHDLAGQYTLLAESELRLARSIEIIRNTKDGHAIEA